MALSLPLTIWFPCFLFILWCLCDNSPNLICTSENGDVTGNEKSMKPTKTVRYVLYCIFCQSFSHVSRLVFVSLVVVQFIMIFFDVFDDLSPIVSLFLLDAFSCTFSDAFCCTICCTFCPTFIGLFVFLIVPLFKLFYVELSVSPSFAFAVALSRLFSARPSSTFRCTFLRAFCS